MRKFRLCQYPPEVAPAAEEKVPELDDEDLEAGPETRATIEEETESSIASKASSWIRTKAWYTRVYAPTVTPPIVLPMAPTDDEKGTYLKTNRLGLHGLGILAFLSLSAGMWLFVISSVAFYWFGAFVVFLQVYMIVSYLTSICGGEFDMAGHQKALDEHPIDALTAPEIDILLPVCMEPIEILENNWNHVEALDWPQDRIKVWVLDDGASDAVKAMAAEERFNFHYICRDNRPLLKKAGNLRYAFALTNAPFFAIFDADFCPRTDFLKEIMPEHMAHPDTCIVQTPQFFRTTSDQSWVEQGAGAVQEVFYRVVQTNRNKWGASVCVGSNAVYCRESRLEVGGTAEIGFSEDVHTGFYAMCRGWKLRYMPIVLACDVCPDTPRAYFSQQMRWAMGSTTLVTNPEFWKSPLTRMQKICFLCGLLYYSAISLSIFMAPLPGMLLVWIRPDYVRYYNLAFAVPSVLFGILVIRCWAKAEYGWNVNFVQQVQTYAYLAAIKKRLLRKGLTWINRSRYHLPNIATSSALVRYDAAGSFDSFQFVFSA
ncbi:Cellulose synthase catalytic subunit [UDP-forming] [Pseudocercospora fuligena]|uniref:Cellulose synthase catalytic subunit [UDP-forming] n=1 Tax=Pseudocercospora fuligena TaxID=685502 RepID=A0A8H6RI74_9PEZI|nr:Cellulose synthase catalytic subunit [UDP-forming] [Pseudocercospora fuligena]